MKNSVMGIVTVLLLLAAEQTFAQSTQVVDARQQVQRARVREGVASGELTRAETARLRSEQRHIRRSERRMKADGKVTRGERARLHHKQNRANRNIRRQKHDSQVQQWLQGHKLQVRPATISSILPFANT